MGTLRVISPTDLAVVTRAVTTALAGGDAVCISSADSESEWVPDEVALVVLTSGSTARPKRVALSATALMASARATAAEIGTGNWALALPLEYIAGVMVIIRTIQSGGAVLDLRSESFNPERFADAVSEAPAGRWFTSLVPTQLNRLIDAAERDASIREAIMRFDRILLGGQGIPAGLLTRAIELGWRVTTTYGAAETAGGVVYDGHPIGDTRVRFEDERVLLSTSSLAIGYLGDHAQTAESFITYEDGTRWWRSTDRGYVEGDRVRISGRFDDIIVSGGVKISLDDIDRVLRAAGIDAVAGWLPDSEWGQVPCVVTTTETDVTTVRAVVERTLGKSARPRRLARVTSLPVLPSGKVDRHRVAQIIEDSEV